VLKPEYIIIGVPGDNDIASRTSSEPDVHQQVEHVMQIDIREQRRSHTVHASRHYRPLILAEKTVEQNPSDRKRDRDVDRVFLGDECENREENSYNRGGNQ
jgi:hypothetical protein